MFLHLIQNGLRAKGSRPDWTRPIGAMSGVDSLAPDGLAINQLLKLKAKGLITTQQFLEMTADLEGSVEELG